ncbi:hypothetical protein BDZ97DRAFT_1925585 [Flammula alnicola]|nr:hypothetical protein BDZ97DRAFT_1925585 [Flammula alnicola]
MAARWEEQGRQQRCDDQEENEDEQQQERQRPYKADPINKCPTRGAAAPPAWTYDPRPVYNPDLQEEVFEPSRDVQDADEGQNDQHQQLGHIPGGPSDHPEPENQVLSSPGYHFVLDLAMACRTFIFDPANDMNPIAQIFKALKTGHNDSGDGSRHSRLVSIMSVDSLENIASRCFMAEENVAVTDFVFMVNAIQLRCKVISTCKSTRKKKTAILDAIQSERSTRTLARYVSDAAKFCLLAGGASFFILAIAAAANLRSNIRNLTHDIILRINYLLRCPNPDHTLGKLVIQDIIPVIALSRTQFRVAFSTMFTQELLISRGVLPEIEAGDLQRSDEFFNSITYNAFIKRRCIRTWASCYSPLEGLVPVIPYYLINHSVLSSTPTSTQDPPNINHTSVDDIPSPLSSLDDDEDLNFNSQSKDASNTNLYTIKTNYNPSLDRNMKTEYKDKTDKTASYTFTQKERKFASLADNCDSLLDITTKLRKQLHLGKKTRGRYLNITHDNLNGKRLRVNDINDNIILLVCPDLPQHLRDRLLASLKAACPNYMKWTDSEALKEFYRFLALHFAWWNRYTASVWERRSFQC